MTEETDFYVVEDSIDLVVDSSKTGEALLGHAQHHLRMGRADGICKTILAEARGQHITGAVYASCTKTSI